MLKQTLTAIGIVAAASMVALPAAVAAPDGASVQVAQCSPCKAKKGCNPCAAKKGCNPCAVKNPCNPCNPCATKKGCNPCAAKNPCKTK